MKVKLILKLVLTLVVLICGRSNLPTNFNHFFEPLKDQYTKLEINLDNNVTRDFYLINCFKDGKDEWPIFKPFVIHIWSQDYHDNDRFLVLWTFLNLETLHEISFWQFEIGDKLIIYPYKLQKGDHVIDITINVLRNEKIFTFKKENVCSLKIKSPDSKAVILGGDRRLISNKDELTLTSHISSFDRMPHSTLTYCWNATKIAGGVSDSNNFISNASAFVLPERYIKESGEIKVNLTVFFENKSYSDDVSLFREPDVANLIVRCYKNCFPVSPVTNHRISTCLKVLCEGNCDSIKDNNYVWRLGMKIGDKLSPVKNSNLFSIQSNKLIIKENVLLPNTTYAVSVYLNGLIKGYAQIFFTTAVLPKIYKCDLDLINSFLYLFTINCSGLNGDYYTLEVYSGDPDINGILIGRGRTYERIIFFLKAGVDIIWVSAVNDFEVFHTEIINVAPRNLQLYNKLTNDDDLIILDQMVKNNLIFPTMQYFYYLRAIDAFDTLQILESSLINGLKSSSMESLNDVFDVIELLDNVLKINESRNLQFLEKVSTLCKQLASNQFWILTREIYPDSHTYKMEKYARSMIFITDYISNATLDFLNWSMIQAENVSHHNYMGINENYAIVVKLLPRIAMNLIEIRTKVAETLLLTKAEGETEIISNFDSILLVKKATGKSMPEVDLLAGQTKISPSLDFKSDPKIYNAIVSNWKENLLLWNKSEQVAGDVVKVEFVNSISGEKRSTFDSPVDIYFDLDKNVNSEKAYKLYEFTFPSFLDEMEMDQLENFITSYKVYVMEKQTLLISFKDFKPYDEYHVVLNEFNKPYLHDFDYNVTVSYKARHEISFTNNKHHDTWIYISMLPSKAMLSSPEMARNESMRTYSVKMRLAVASCYTWKESSSSWETYCKAANKTTFDTIHCECNHLSVITAGLSEPVFFVATNRVYINTESLASSNGMILVFLIMTMCVYVIALVFGLGQQKQEIFYVADNLWCDRYVYMLHVVTGFQRTAGTTSNVVIKLNGSLKESRPHVINFPDPNIQLLQRQVEDWFVITTEGSLGDIIGIEIWHDSIGFSPTWFCEQMHLIDMQDSIEWTFKIQKNFSVTKKRGQYCIAKPISQAVIHNIQESSAQLEIYGGMSWYTKVTLSVSGLVVAFALKLALSAFPSYDAAIIYRDQAVNKSIPVIWFILIGSCVSVYIHLCLIYLLKNAAHQFQDRERHPTRFSFRVTITCWIILVLLMFSAISYLLFIDVWIPYKSPYFWLSSFVVSVILQTCMYLHTYNLVRLCFSACASSVASTENTNILDQIESQRDYIHNKFGGMGFRPYFSHLYEKPSKKSIPKQKLHDEILVEIIEIAEDLVMVAVYMVILSGCIFALDRDPMMVYSNKHVTSLLKGLETHSEISVDEDEDIYRYLISAFYASFYLRSQNRSHTAIDQMTTILSPPRLRMVQVKQNSCKAAPFMIELLNTTCENEYSTDLNEEGAFSQGWVPIEGTMSTQLMWTYSDSVISHSAVVQGVISTYTGGGYLIELQSDRKRYQELLTYMQQYNWIYKSTRVVFLDVVLYNVHLNVFSMCRILFEKSATGLYSVSFKVRGKRLVYVNDEMVSTFFKLCGIIIFWMALIVFKRTSGLVRSMSTFFKDIWNTVDLAIIITSIMCISLIYMRTTMVERYLQLVEIVNYYRFIPGLYLLRLEQLTMIISSILILCSTARLWKLLRFGRVFRIMEMTIRNAWFPLFCGILVQVLILSAFAVVGVVVFGNYSRDFEGTVESTITTLLLLSINLSNVFDYTTLQNIRLGLGYIYFSVYLLIMLALYSLYKTIVIMAYLKAKQHFSNELANEYTAKDYMMDIVGRLFKTFRLEGGADISKQKVVPKADEFRFANSYYISSRKMQTLEYLTLCFIRNQNRTDSGKLSTYDLILICKILGLIYNKKLTRDSKEVFFKGRLSENVRVQFIDEVRIIQMERVATFILKSQKEHTLEERKQSFSKPKISKDEPQMVQYNKVLTVILDILNNIEIDKPSNDKINKPERSKKRKPKRKDKAKTRAVKSKTGQDKTAGPVESEAPKLIPTESEGAASKSEVKTSKVGDKTQDDAETKIEKDESSPKEPGTKKEDDDAPLES